MTTLHERRGRRYHAATDATIIRVVMRSPTLRGKIIAALLDHPDMRCHGCSGLDEGGRVAEIDHGAHTWITCDDCRVDGALTCLMDSVLPGES